MSENSLDPNNKGLELIRDWAFAAKQVEKAEADLKVKQEAFANTSNKFGEWLIPECVKHGEKILLAVGEGFIQSVKIEKDVFRVKWYKKPSWKSLSQLRIGE